MNRHQIIRTTARLVGGTVVAAVASAAVCLTATADTTSATATTTMVNLDLNADGRDDATAYDLDANGVYERLLYDQTGDAATDFSMFDDDQNGRFERAEVDSDHDGASDLFADDPNEDQVWDTVRSADEQDDLESAVLDATVVGPATNLDPETNLLLRLAAETGHAAYGTPDSDHDQWNDNEDSYPSDWSRH